MVRRCRTVTNFGGEDLSRVRPGTGEDLSAGEREWVEEFLSGAPTVGELEVVWLCKVLVQLAA